MNIGLKNKNREEQRPKYFCHTCNVFKSIKNVKLNLCQNCWHKVKRKTQPEFFLRTRYTELVQRCINPNTNKHTYKCYYGKTFCTREEFLNKFLLDPIFLSLFHNWQKNNNIINLCPSIDRINNKLDYSIDNLQFLTHIENIKKDKIIAINCYHKNIFVRKFESQSEASRQLNLEQSNIWKVLNKERKTTGGYYFEYA